MVKSDLTDYLEADLYRYNGAKAACYFFKAMSPSLAGFRYTYVLRHASIFPKKSIRGLFYRALLLHYSHKYGFQMQPNTRIGKGLYIGHIGTLVINGKSELGNNCSLGHLVTIGQTNRGKRKGCPKIGNNVWIGAGAVIVGKIIIGNNVLIAPNSYVNFDVPRNSVVTGNPAVVQSHANATKDYNNFTFNEKNKGVKEK
jgi:serine O-acetyltransferase